jgi:hypothetical protein
VGLLAFFLAIALIRVFRTPLKLALKLLANTLLGFLALWVTNFLAGVTGFFHRTEYLERPDRWDFGRSGICTAAFAEMDLVVHRIGGTKKNNLQIEKTRDLKR